MIRTSPRNLFHNSKAKLTNLPNSASPNFWWECIGGNYLKHWNKYKTITQPGRRGSDLEE